MLRAPGRQCPMCGTHFAPEPWEWLTLADFAKAHGVTRHRLSLAPAGLLHAQRIAGRVRVRLEVDRARWPA